MGPRQPAIAVTAFSWRVNARRDWPPRGRPRRPYGPTTVEIVRSCPARAAFSASPAYERRLGSAARVGLAMHSALESLVSDPIAKTDPAEVAAEARRRFEAVLSAQLEQAQARVRERDQPLDLSRAEAAAEAVVGEAMRILRIGGRPPSLAGSTIAVEVEVPVRSRDGLFEGIVDRAERDERGVHLIDYKSASRGDLPDRYRRQLQLYAYIWHDSRDEWPASGRVVYSAIGTSYRVDVDPDECLRVAADAQRLLEALEAVDGEPIAQPGEVCAVCEYRPWCAPFWQWVAAGPPAERLDRASLGLEAAIDGVHADAAVVRLSLDVGGTPVSITLRAERFAHARDLRPGDRVRLLDVRLRGLRSQPTAFATPSAELFIVDRVDQ